MPTKTHFNTALRSGLRAEGSGSLKSQEGALLDQALAPIRIQLQGVMTRILSALQDPVARMVVYLIAAGGKRLRPALVLLAGGAGRSPNWEALIEASAAVELIHTATLIHDDIIDESPLRRSQPTVHARWGIERAVLMGDYLYATAFTLLARIGSPEVMQTMSEVCQELSRGELREVEARHRLDLSESEYLAIIRDKTASLISGCCRCGASLGGVSDQMVDHFTEFGVNFGLAFQIMDDCLDLIGDQRELGKSIHVDLDKGALSLPMIYLAQTLSASQRRRLFTPLQQRTPDRALLARIAKQAQAAGAIAKAQTRARQFIQSAQHALASLPLNGLARAYEQLAAYAVLRRS